MCLRHTDNTDFYDPKESVAIHLNLRHLCATQIPIPMQIYSIRPKPPHPAPLNFVRKFKLPSAAPPTAPSCERGQNIRTKRGYFSFGTCSIHVRSKFVPSSFQVRSAFTPMETNKKRTWNEHKKNLPRGPDGPICKILRQFPFLNHRFHRNISKLHHVVQHHEQAVVLLVVAQVTDAIADVQRLQVIAVQIKHQQLRGEVVVRIVLFP